jgi:hypothetical protein
MSTRMATALVAAVVALAPPALAAGSGNRNNETTSKLSQFCIPQDDIPDAPTVYC